MKTRYRSLTKSVESEKKPVLNKLTKQIFAAIKNNHLQELSSLISAANINLAIDEEGNAPLHIAAYFGRLEIAKWLHLNKATHHVNDNGWFPLHIAVDRENSRLIDFFITNMQIDINLQIQNEDLHTTLGIAAAGNNLKVLKTLVDLGAKFFPDKMGWFPLQIAAHNNQPLSIEFFAKEMKVDINIVSQNKWRESALHIAAREGNINSASVLIKNGATHLPNAFGLKPIHIAAKNDQAEFIDYLINEEKVDIYSPADNDSKRTPLHLAIEKGAEKTVRRLLLFNPALPFDEDGWSPLHCAARYGHSQLIEFFVTEMKMDVNQKSDNQWGDTPLHAAVEFGTLEATKTLFKLGAIYADNDEGLYPIHLAAQRNKDNLIKFLVHKMKVNVDQLTEDGNKVSALHIAAENGNLEAIMMLDSLGAQHLEDDDGEFPIHRAVQFPHLLEFFIHHMKININSETSCNRKLTPLHIAAQRGYLEGAKTLVSLGASHRPNTIGVYPIHTAAAKDQTSLLEYFCDVLKVDVNTRTNDNNSPLHFAVGFNALKSALLLISRGAEHFPINNDDNYYPLHIAARSNHPEMIRLLVEKGKADVSQTNKHSETPLIAAIKADQYKAVNILLKLGATITTKCFESVRGIPIFFELYIKSLGLAVSDPVLEKTVFHKLLFEWDDLLIKRKLILCILSYHQNPKIFLENLMNSWEKVSLSFGNFRYMDLNINSKDIISTFILVMRGSVEEYLTLAKEIKGYMLENNCNFFEIMRLFQSCDQLKNIIKAQKDFNFCRLPLNLKNNILRFLVHSDLKTKPSKIFEATRPTKDDLFNKELATEASYQIRFFKRLNEKKVEQPIYITCGSKRIRLTTNLINKIQNDAKLENNGEYVAGNEMKF